MLTKTVEYVVEDGGDGEEASIRLVVSQATVLIGMKRAVLQGSAESWVAAQREEVLADSAGDGDDDPSAGNGHKPEILTLMAGALAARILYPDLIASVVEAEGLDVGAMTVDGFLELPDRLTNAWETVVYELNPHWLPGPKAETQEAAGAEKKG